MKCKLFVISVTLVFFVCACNRPQANQNVSNRAASPTPAASRAIVPDSSVNDPIKDGDYDGKGTVTKLNMELGSVEMDHEEIPGVMAAMRMEFYVTDKKMLDGLKVGDRVDFVLRYKDRTETVVKISKAK